MARHEILHPDSLRQLQGHVNRLEQEVQNVRRRLSAFRCELDDGPDSRGGCLDEDHPGRGVLFDIHLGTWDSAGIAPHWNYEAVDTVKAIDWRYGVPFPAAGATGLFEARKSDVHGTVWEVTSLDCESPGVCGS